MYQAFYQLTERPFSITPNPRYVFLSRQHQDALAHLLYGIGTGGSGGFVQLTGEVGTGKTTLCRLMLEEVPAQTEVALILNPMLGPVELLEAICDELEIPIAKEDAGRLVKLQSALNRYLLACHEKNKRVVLIIDEAQNLSEEALEQVRLLTNLETATEKLLQIILIGQPELRSLLRRPSLRQLAQRITARYHLEALDQEETSAYVKHRLMVAGAAQCPFTEQALKVLFEVTGGIPRLINIIADRAMLAGFAHENAVIDGITVKTAAQEIAGETNEPPASGVRGKLAFGVVTVLVVMGLGLVWLLSQENRLSSPRAGQFWEEVLASGSGQAGWQEAASVWLGATAPSIERACAADRSRETDFACLSFRGSWSYLASVDFPVLLRLTAAEPTYLLLTGLGDQTVEVRMAGQTYQVSKQRIERDWQGEFLVVWPDSGELWQVGDEDPAIALAKQLASALADQPWQGDQTQRLDPAFERWLIEFQSRHSIIDDGVIGPATRLFLRHPQSQQASRALMPLRLAMRD